MVGEVVPGPLEQLDRKATAPRWCIGQRLDGKHVTLSMLTRQQRRIRDQGLVLIADDEALVGARGELAARPEELSCLFEQGELAS